MQILLQESKTTPIPMAFGWENFWVIKTAIGLQLKAICLWRYAVRWKNIKVLVATLLNDSSLWVNIFHLSFLKFLQPLPPFFGSKSVKWHSWPIYFQPDDSAALEYVSSSIFNKAHTLWSAINSWKSNVIFFY